MRSGIGNSPTDPFFTSNSVGGAAVSSSNPLPVASSSAGNATATPTQVAATTSATNLLAANSGRRGATIYYDGAAILYLLEGSGTPSATVYTTKLGAGYFTQYDAPAGFTGAIRGIWSAATGSANVTERTA